MARSLKEYLELGYNTYLLSLATVFMGVATITIVTTGIVTLTHFNDDECTVWTFDGGDMTKNNVEEKVDEIVYIFIAGLLATGIYGAFVMRQKNQNDTTVMKFFGMGSSFIFGFVGALLITVAIYMIQMGVLTASCTTRMARCTCFRCTPRSRWYFFSVRRSAILVPQRCGLVCSGLVRRRGM
jgi:hypothetical protein